MEDANDNSDKQVEGAAFPQHTLFPEVPDFYDAGHLHTSNGFPQDPYQGTGYLHEREIETEFGEPYNETTGHDEDKTPQMFMSSQNAQGTHGDGLPAYRPPRPKPEPDDTLVPSALNCESAHAQSFPVDVFNTSAAHRPLSPYRAFEPSWYHGGGGEGDHFDFSDSHALRPYQSAPHIAGRGVTDSYRSSSNAMPSVQSHLQVQRQGMWAQPSRAYADPYFQQASQGYVNTSSTVSPFAKRRDPGVDVEGSAVSGRTRGIGKRSAKPRPSGAGRPRDKFQCVDCLELGRQNYYCHTMSTGDLPGQERCRKHQAKWVKEQASTQVPMYHFDQGISSFETAKTLVYPAIPAIIYEGDGDDDVVFYREAEDEWVKRFIDASNIEFTGDGEALRDNDDKRIHEHLLKQQDTYNHKPHEKSSKESYTNDFINIRMRFLFCAVLTFHEGGPAIYPVGGANGGYGEDTTLAMSKRLAAIEDILKQEKRVVMDVVEGRGVLALAANPKHYMDRKQSNNKCNTKKKGKFAIADAVEAGQIPTPGAAYHDDGEDERDAAPTPVRRRGRSKRKAGPQGQRGASSKLRTPAPGPAKPTPEYTAPAANMTHSALGDGAVAGKYEAANTFGYHDESHITGNGDAAPGPWWQQQQPAQGHELFDHAAPPMGSEWQDCHPEDFAAASVGIDKTSTKSEVQYQADGTPPDGPFSSLPWDRLLADPHAEGDSKDAEHDLDGGEFGHPAEWSFNAGFGSPDSH
ncbi:hypothetical protein LTR36_003891 [Oleoguttula mirabilis]|uniref:Uncharacterized protein n=1 Tax=Oleoguttula mirabilis TaxID=1507867 RepID=A0AAV9JJ57_9PEZI|nr:hypothetical protein LTR36_003891 [Oleoguttula mirabilis]